MLHMICLKTKYKLYNTNAFVYNRLEIFYDSNGNYTMQMEIIE